MKKIFSYLKVKSGGVKYYNLGNTRFIILSILSIILVSTLLLGSTYSLFRSSNVDEDLHVYKTGNLDITYTLSEDNIVFSNNVPISGEEVSNIVPYRITVNNLGNVAYKFNLILVDTTAINVIDYQYIMVQVGVLESVSLADCSNNVIQEDVIVSAGESVDIDIRVWLSEAIPNNEIGKSFYAKLSIDGLAVYDEIGSVDNRDLILPSVTEFVYTGEEQSYVVSSSGYYKLEAWGAQGGHYDDSNYGGKGAYTSGEIYLEKGTKLYVYVGGQGPAIVDYTNIGGYNGGGYSGNHTSAYSSGGGGSTDFRLVGGAWNDFESLKSRIMVAAGGGGSAYEPTGVQITWGGYGGALVGGNGDGTYNSVTSTGATQTSTGTGRTTDYIGFFGFGLQSNTDGYGGGAGGGYYAGVNGHGKGGSGGSSFVSGYKGCNAISEFSTSDNIVHLGVSEHYSGYVFKNSSMISGNENMPTKDSSSIQLGNVGDGYARITYIRNRSDIETVYAYIGDYQTYEVIQDGYYQLEAWGAQGGHYDDSNYGGKGAYTSGEIYLEKGTNLYVYVGGQGPAIVDYTNIGGYNGGGYSGDNSGAYSFGGGGSTDFRLVDGVWNDFESLKSRIMVAAGGGGTAYAIAGNQTTWGGYGGALVGGNGDGTYSNSVITTGATQTSTGTGYGNTYLGVFGYALQTYTVGYGGGGGGGYYGGVNGYGRGGSGGSSFISGYSGCNAISESSTSDNIVHLGDNKHYSGLVFNNSLMIAGNEEMPTYSGDDTKIGNTGNGYVKIKYLGN